MNRKILFSVGWTLFGIVLLLVIDLVAMIMQSAGPAPQPPARMIYPTPPSYKPHPWPQAAYPAPEDTGSPKLLGIAYLGSQDIAYPAPPAVEEFEPVTPISPPKSILPLLTSIDAVLEPGAWQGWAIRPSEARGGYLVAVTPLEPSVEGDFIERALVQPEFDGRRWNDVLRVLLPAGQPRLKVNLKVYDTASLPVVMEFDTLLQPGTWHGFGIGPASANRGYVVEVSPLEPGTDGDCVGKIHIQPEFSGEWIDVLRVQIAESQNPLRVHIRVYETSSLPLVQEFEAVLEPGVWMDSILPPIAENNATVIEVTPLGNYDAAAEIAYIQPTFDGQRWYAVLHMYTDSWRPSLKVNVCIYRVN